MNRFRILKKKDGITLVELLITLALISIAISGIVLVFLFGIRVFNFGSDQYDYQGNARFASQYITEEVRYAAKIDIVELSPTIQGYIADPSTIPVYQSFLFYDSASGEIHKLNRYTSTSKTLGPNGYLNFWSVSASADKILKYKIEAGNGTRKYTIDNEVNSLNLDLSDTKVIGTTGLTDVSAGGKVLKYVTIGDFMSASQMPLVVIGTLNSNSSLEIKSSKAIQSVSVVTSPVTSVVTIPNAYTTRFSFTPAVSNNTDVVIQVVFYELSGTSTYVYTLKYGNSSTLWSITN